MNSLSLPSKKSHIDVRGLKYAMYEWGDDNKPTLFLLHGWMDTGASFQFMAPYLIDHFHLVAVDWRGFGDTDHVSTGYWFPDYYADLDEVLRQYAPNQAVNLVGHSMGANIALSYSGLRPERVANMLVLDWIGLVQTNSADHPKRFRTWLNEVAMNEPTKVYPNKDALKASMRKGNPSFTDEIIHKLMPIWAKPAGENGQMMLRGDHKHRTINPLRYNLEDAIAMWRDVTARVGFVMATKPYQHRISEYETRIELLKETLNVADQDFSLIEDSHHMLHIERPEETAQQILAFFNRQN